MASTLRDTATRGLNAVWYCRSLVIRLLWPVHVVMLGLIAARRWLYARRWRESSDVGRPVVIIGNLTVGGTGKTPLTIWLAGRLTAQGFRVGIVCSGYGGRAEQWPQAVSANSDAGLVGDEALLLARRTGCRVAAGRDRVAAARALLAAGPLDLILSDDGLQHYRLRRAIEIVVVDGTRGLGNRMCLPAGPLREPVSRLDSVAAVVVNEGDLPQPGAIRVRTEALRVVELATGAECALAAFAGQRVHAVAAIGNPARFFALLGRAGIEVEPHPHADHARLAAEDLDFRDGAPVLITEKDAVKCDGLDVPAVFYVVSGVEFAAGDEDRLFGMVLGGLQSGVGNR
jgi:tetraacyldisaccharide 4'-kinase